MLSSLSSSGRARANGVTAGFTNQQPLPRRAAADPSLLLRALEHLKQQRQPAGCSGDEGAVAEVAVARRLEKPSIVSAPLTCSGKDPAGRVRQGCFTGCADAATKWRARWRLALAMFPQPFIEHQRRLAAREAS